MVRFVDFNEFIKLPKGTVFSEYEHDNNNLYILDRVLYKEDGTHRDYNYTDLGYYGSGMGSIVDGAVIGCRWGLYDYNCTYIVYEKEDVMKILKELTIALMSYE